jgi:hypothetical protein
MIPRPLHRWKSFWLGIIVLLFLGWSWNRSLDRNEGFILVPWQPWNLTCEHVRGAMKVTLGTRLLPPGRRIEYFNYSYSPTAKLSHLLTRPALTWRKTFRSWSVLIGHGPLMLCFLVPWASFLAWRWRRQRQWHLTSASP